MMTPFSSLEVQMAMRRPSGDHVGLALSLSPNVSDGHCLVEGKRSLLDAFGQCRSFHQLHDKRAGAIRFFEAVDGSYVRMIKGGEDFCFALEARHSVGVPGKRLGQDFDRHVAVQTRIRSAVHFAHSARADLRLNAIVRDGLRSHGVPLRAILRPAVSPVNRKRTPKADTFGYRILRPI